MAPLIMDGDGVAAVKRALRREALARRAAAHAASGEAAALAVRDRVLALTLPPAAIVAGYWPMREELDPRPTLLALCDRGHRLALPVVVERRHPLVFRRWCRGEPLVPDALGLPAPMATAGETIPGVLLVPLVAFDRSGGRLGYGAGFYDRTLDKLRARWHVMALGLAFAAQEVEDVPVEEADEPLDGIVTERGTLWCR